MSLRSALWTILSAGLLLAGSTGQAAEETVTWKGLTYFDYFYTAQHPDEAQQGVYGAQIRRVYLTFDHAIAPGFKARFRLETNSELAAIKSVELESGKTKTTNPITEVKDAYVQWTLPGDWTKTLKPALVFGIQSTPTFGFEEGIWSYRSVEKTIEDLRKISSSRDLGVGLKGKLGDSGAAYYLLLGNDSRKSESNQEKRLYGRLSYQKSGVVGELTGYFRQLPDDPSEFFGKVGAGYQTDQYTGYAVAFARWRTHQGDVDTTVQTLGLSLFGHVKIAEKLRALGRVDWFDPNTDADEDASLLLIVGVDYQATKNLNLIPNLWVEQPQASDQTATVLPRLTVYYRF